MLKRRNKNIDLALADAERIVKEAESTNRIEKTLKKFNISYKRGDANISLTLYGNVFDYKKQEYVIKKFVYILSEFDNDTETLFVVMTCESDKDHVWMTYDEFISNIILDYVNQQNR